MKQNREPRNRPIHIWSITFQENDQSNFMGKKQSRYNFDIYLEKNEPQC